MRFFQTPLGSLLLLALFLAGTVLFVLPTRTVVAELQVQELTLADALSVLEFKVNSLSALSEQVSQSDAAKTSLKRSLPVGMAQDQLILDLKNLATSTGFSVNSLNFSQAQHSLGPSLLISANVTGTYDKLLEFLQKLENAERLIRVTSMNVQRTSTTDVVFSLQMEALYQ